MASAARAPADDFAPNATDRQAVALCLAHADGAAADGAQDRGDRDDCIGSASSPCLAEEANMTTVGQVMCVARETAIWDEYLNRDYAALRERLDAPVFAGLRDAQRKWIAFRDANCALPHAIYEGGSMARPIAAWCLLDMTGRRANELASLLGSLEL